MSDFNCQTEEIEVYESSSHEERKKPSQDTEKERTFSLHSTATNHANDETEEKEEHLQFFFFTRKIRRQRISTCE